MKRTVSLGKIPLFTAEKDVTVSMLELELPNDPDVSIMDVAHNQIEVRLYRNSYTDDALLRTFELSRGRPVSVLSNKGSAEMNDPEACRGRTTMDRNEEHASSDEPLFSLGLSRQ